jgi:hypothetical protein
MLLSGIPYSTPHIIRDLAANRAGLNGNVLHNENTRKRYPMFALKEGPCRFGGYRDSVPTPEARCPPTAMDSSGSQPICVCCRSKDRNASQITPPD